MAWEHSTPFLVSAYLFRKVIYRPQSEPITCEQSDLLRTLLILLPHLQNVTPSVVLWLLKESLAPPPSCIYNRRISVLWFNTPNEFQKRLKIQTFDHNTPILIGFSP
ncbi:hypothetical protein AVEN_149579-1 [Araneus ventricosus]|uniref:Uncharacterized protein n=1 Tax=Araneus ventricosus TaxID=182803 RepID=A0A4Y2DP15_ARAVE|nr:hypothetical protein AVEN_156006-1 [Araneus ventricosus]GBN42831.1 hypothetical protein AVEN_149579-1 [Araneus ventricosus]